MRARANWCPLNRFQPSTAAPAQGGAAADPQMSESGEQSFCPGLPLSLPCGKYLTGAGQAEAQMFPASAYTGTIWHKIVC